jgi:hypothetical protein
VRGRAPRHSTRRTGPDSVVRREGEGASGSDDRAGGAKSGPLSPLLRPRLRRTQPRSPVPPADSSSNPVTSKPEQGKPPDQGAPSNRRKNCATGCSHRLKPHSSAARVPPSRVAYGSFFRCAWALLLDMVSDLLVDIVREEGPEILCSCVLFVDTCNISL